MAGFGTGAALSSMNNSMLQWRRMFLEEEQVRNQEEQYNKSIAIQQQENAAARAHALDMQRIQDDAANQRLTEQQGYEAGMTLIEGAIKGEFNLQQLEGLGETLQSLPGTASTLGKMLPIAYSSAFLKNPAQAAEYVQRLYSAALDPTVAATVNPTMAEEAWGYLVKANAWDEEQAKEARVDYDKVLQAVQGNREAAAEGLGSIFTTGVQQAQATLGKTVAETGEIAATTEAVRTSTSQAKERFPQEMQLLGNQVAISGSQATMADIEAGYHDRNLAVAYRTAVATMDIAESDVEIRRQVQDDIVEQYRTELKAGQLGNQLTELDIERSASALYVDLQTQDARIAIENGNVDLLESSINQINTSIDEARQRISSAQIDDNIKQDELDLLRIQSEGALYQNIAQWIESGQPEVVRPYLTRIAEITGIANPEEFIQSVEDRATQNQTIDRQLELVGYEMAVAEKDQARFTADNQERVLSHNIALDNGHLRVAQRHAGAAETQAGAAVTSANASMLNASTNAWRAPWEVQTDRINAEANQTSSQAQATQAAVAGYNAVTNRQIGIEETRQGWEQLAVNQQTANANTTSSNAQMLNAETNAAELELKRNSPTPTTGAKPSEYRHTPGQFSSIYNDAIEAISDSELIENKHNLGALTGAAANQVNGVVGATINWVRSMEMELGPRPDNATPEQLIKYLPPELQNLSSAHNQAILTQAGLLEPVDPAINMQTGEYDPNTPQGQAALVQEFNMPIEDVAMERWEAMPQEEKAKYPLGPVSVQSEIGEELAVRESEQMEKTERNANVVRVVGNIYGVVPVMGDQYSQAQLAESKTLLSGTLYNLGLLQENIQAYVDAQSQPGAAEAGVGAPENRKDFMQYIDESLTKNLGTSLMDLGIEGQSPAGVLRFIQSERMQLNQAYDDINYIMGSGY